VTGQKGNKLATPAAETEAARAEEENRTASSQQIQAERGGLSGRDRKQKYREEHLISRESTKAKMNSTDSKTDFFYCNLYKNLTLKHRCHRPPSLI
jgi:hypothetical protein